MIAGLTTGSIIAMAMDFNMWPRVHIALNPGQPCSENPESKAEENTVNVSDYIIVEKEQCASTAMVSDVNSGSEEKTVEKLDSATNTSDSTEKQVTQLLSSVPDDDVIVHPTSLEEQTGIDDSAPSKSDSTNEQITSPLTEVTDNEPNKLSPGKIVSVEKQPSGEPENDTNSTEEDDSNEIPLKKMESSLTDPVPSDSEEEPPPKTILETAQENGGEDSETQS